MNKIQAHPEKSRVGVYVRINLWDWVRCSTRFSLRLCFDCLQKSCQNTFISYFSIEKSFSHLFLRFQSQCVLQVRTESDQPGSWWASNLRPPTPCLMKFSPGKLPQLIWHAWIHSVETQCIDGHEHSAQWTRSFKDTCVQPFPPSGDTFESHCAVGSVTFNRDQSALCLCTGFRSSLRSPAINTFTSRPPSCKCFSPA